MCFIVCCIAKIYQSITLEKVGYCGNTSGFSKKLPKSHRTRDNNWHMINFIPSASEVGIKKLSSGNNLDGVKLASIHFQTKSIKSKATFLRKSFLKLQNIRLVPANSSCMPTHWNSCFIAITMKKHLAVHFPKRYFFVNLLAEKLWVQCQNITCLLKINTGFPFFFFT